MGLMRRVESSIENAVDAPRRPAPETRTPRTKDRDPALRVQPKELAQKLVKEMEDHKVSRQGVVSVSDHYTVYLCPDDYDRFADRLDDLTYKLERALLKHVRSRKYQMVGELEVVVVREPALRRGYFGILAERAAAGQVGSRGRADKGRPREPRPHAPTASTASQRPAVVHELPARGTMLIPPAEAAQLGLAAQAIVLRAGDRMREFNQGRVILGRARDVDFRIDDPNVSRRHAAIFWADGEVVVEDLHSTNGTMVNGYPVTRTVLRPRDVLAIGDARITVEIKSG